MDIDKLTHRYFQVRKYYITQKNKCQYKTKEKGDKL